MPFAFRPHRRSGLTLVEILIALTMTLIVLGTMITAFKFASEEMQEGRALIELANRARVVEDHLRTDLGSLTVETRVYNGTVEPTGYFEYVEGPVRDASFAVGADSFQGDCDDLLCFTARSTDGILFRGRRKTVTFNGNANDDMTLSGTTPIESSLAEIAWFTTVNDNDNEVGPLEAQADLGGSVSSADFDDSIQVRRRVLLIRPGLGTLATNLSGAEVNNFIRNNDISVRVVPTTGSTSTFDIIANELNELAVRKHRFAHQQNLTTGDINVDNRFPNTVTFNLLRNRIASDDSENVNYGLGHSWQSLPPILSDVGAFDFKAYSPTARVNVDATSGVIVEPSDLGYDQTDTDLTALGAAVDLVQRGAYVDLAYSVAAPATRSDEWFISDSNKPTTVAVPTVTNFWDTWTPFYERDGVDQDKILGADQGTNGVNDIRPGDIGDFPVASNVIDDPGERETIPPYFQPIRAMKITLRLVEKGTKQVHQVSVIHSFVPE